MGAPAVYRVREHETVAVPPRHLLGRDGDLRLNPEVESKDYFAINSRRGRLCLKARGYIGLIPLNERVSIDVAPRTPVENLLRLLNVARQPLAALTEERGYATESRWSGSLLDVYAHALIDRIEAVADQGLLREYERRVETTAFPRGRVLAAASARRSPAPDRRVVTARFEPTCDNAPNRCLKYAIWFLAQQLREATPLGRERKRLLDRAAPLFELLGEARLDRSLGFLRAGTVTGSEELPSLRAYYRPALDLAAAMIQLHGVRLEGGDGPLRLPSMVLDMSGLFERYLRNVLAAQASERGWTRRVLDGNAAGKARLFDDEPSPEATPDIVVRDADAEGASLLIEVKNVPVKDRHSERAAIEQAITYGLSFRCNQVVLAHPRRDPESFRGLRLQGRIGDVSLHQYVFDLAADPIEREEERFAAAMEGLATS